MQRKLWVASFAIISMVMSSILVSVISVTPSVAKEASLQQLLGNKTAVEARKDFLKQFGKSTKKSANLSYKIDPKFNSGLKHEVMVDTQVSAYFWADIRPVDQKVKIYIAPTNNMQFIYKNMWPTRLSGSRLGFKSLTNEF